MKEPGARSVNNGRLTLAEVTTALGETSFVALAYFLAAQVGLALLSQPSDVAVFWPASGIAAGILIVGGRRIAPALVVGVVVGTIAANLMSDRGLLTSLFKGFCNAGEAILIAWLLERWFVRAFNFGNLRRVVGFLAATVIATATSAVGGAATMILLHTTAPYGDAWQAWFLSGAVGMVMVAPLVIGLSQLWRKLPSQSELIEGLTAIGVVTLTSMYVVSCPTTSWVSFCTGALVLPMLLWLAARCSPMFAIAGAFISSAAVIYATIFGIGHFGDSTIPILERVKGAQAAVLMLTVFTLVLVALLSEGRSREEQLHRLLGALPAAIYTTDKAGRITYCNRAAVKMWGVTPQLGKDRWTNFCRLYYPDGSPMSLDDYPTQICLREGRAVGGREAILERPDGTRIPIIPSPAPLIDEQGAVAGAVSMKLDITERKRAELALAERNLQLSLAGKAAGVGSYTYDAVTDIMRISEGYAAVHGLAESTTETTLNAWRTRTHPDDRVRVEEAFRQAFRDRRGEYAFEYRIVRPDGSVRWIETRSFFSYDRDWHPERVIGVNIDVTERKQAEEHKALLIAELDHRVKNALASVVVIAQHARVGSASIDEFFDVFNGRIQSLANAHALLSRSRWQGVSLAALVRGELAPCMNAKNTSIQGPDVDLAAEATQPMSMVLHELVTNATKYGALSNTHGRVSASWECNANGRLDGGLAFEWRETGGPPVVAPNKSGYGATVIRDLIPYELAGTVDYDFAPEGVRCKLEIPAKWVSKPPATVI